MKNTNNSLNSSHPLNKTSIFTTILNPLILIVLAISWGVFLYMRGIAITGPFIFGDELTYLSFARHIFQGNNLSDFTQYGPAYPALISIFLFLKNSFSSYDAIRTFNILFFIFNIFPAYYLGLALFKNNALRLLLPICTLLTPFSGMVYIVWADPIYMTLFYVTCYLLYYQTKKSDFLSSFLYGASLSILYYTKPAAGLCAALAGLLTFTLYLLQHWQTLPKSRIKFHILAVLFSLVLSLPWMIHYLQMGLSIIGYPTATNELHTNLITHGYINILTRIIFSTFYQFSYVFIGTWGLIGIFIGLSIKQWKNLSQIEQNIISFTLFYTFGIICLSAIGMATNSLLDYRMPSGRYLTLIHPLIICLSLHLIQKATKESTKINKIALSTLSISVIICLIATPLYTRNPIAFNSMPDISPIIYISDHSKTIWRAMIEEPTLNLRIETAIFFGLFSLGIILFRKRPFASILSIVLIITGSLFSSFIENFYIVSQGKSELHAIYHYLINHHITEVMIDKKMEQDNSQFLTPFWMDKNSYYIDQISLSKAKMDNKIIYFISRENLTYNKLFSSKPYFIYQIGG